MSKARIFEAVKNLDLDTVRALLDAKPALLTATDRQAGKDRHEQRNHPHTAKPLRQRALEEETATVVGEDSHDRGTRRGEARHRFEHRVD